MQQDINVFGTNSHGGYQSDFMLQNNNLYVVLQLLFLKLVQQRKKPRATWSRHIYSIILGNVYMLLMFENIPLNIIKNGPNSPIWY